ncbi:hypothetical protein JZ751_027893 [Albula glossodonta]|uniref:Uncharacterized protein n=1 Tax=Albula glossodonta TaxID=121402 RepID=A0A8T2PBS8_9TELE|nr:hypothetical protein JZ751_027893 [Albula glossodonta]
MYFINNANYNRVCLGLLALLDLLVPPSQEGHRGLVRLGPLDHPESLGSRVVRVLPAAMDVQDHQAPKERRVNRAPLVPRAVQEKVGLLGFLGQWGLLDLLGHQAPLGLATDDMEGSGVGLFNGVPGVRGPEGRQVIEVHACSCDIS